MLSTAEKGAESEIVGRKSRSDATSFLEWLKTEHEKAASDTSLLTYDRFFSESMDTPEGAAANLTNIINFDLEGVVNWQEQFEFAFPILSNLNLEKSDSWKFRGFFLAYIRGSKADARAKVFARFIEAEQAPQYGIPPLMDTRPLLPYFHGGTELDLALKAAIEMELLNKIGKWAHIGEKTKAVSIFWRAAVTARLAKADAPIYKVTAAMKEQFSMKLGQNAIDKKKEIADFGEKYREIYKNLLAIMRP